MHTAARNDETLVEASLRGDRDAFGELVRKYQTFVQSVAFSRTGNLTCSEDVTQQTFVTAWNSLHKLRNPRKFPGWLAGMARNLARREARLRARECHEPIRDDTQMRTLESAGLQSSPLQQCIAREEQHLVERALTALPQTYREPLILYYRQDKSVSDVARLLNLSENAVKQRLARGRKLMSRDLRHLVEMTLASTRPGESSALAILAALPTSTPAAACTAGAVYSKVAAWGAAGGLGALGGIAGSVFGCWNSLRHATSRQERHLTWSLIRLVGALVVLLLATQHYVRTVHPDVYADAWFQALLWGTYLAALVALIVVGNRATLAVKRIHGTPGEQQAYADPSKSHERDTSRLQRRLSQLSWSACAFCTFGVVALFGAAAGASAANRTQTFRLENGLQVILRPIATAKTSAVLVLFDVGEQNDPAGKSGLAHLVEHLYVTAAAGNQPARNIQQYLAAYPQGWNAQTGFDYTVISTVVSPDRLDAEIRDAAARMHDLQIEEADLHREVPRILQEVANMFKNVPTLLGRNHLRNELHPLHHGARHGGLPEQVRRLTLDDVRTHYRRYYKPGNARLVIAGALDPTRAAAQIRSAFAGIASGERPPRPPAPLMPRVGEKKVAVAKIPQDGSSQLWLGYRTPEPTAKDYPAFLVIVARLQELAGRLSLPPQDFPVLYMPVDDPSTLYVWSRVAPSESPESVLAKLDHMVAEASRVKPTAAQQARAKQQFAFLLGIADLPDAVLAGNPYGVAFGLARRSQWNLDSRQLARAVDRVIARDIEQGASRYLTEPQRAVVSVEPSAP